MFIYVQRSLYLWPNHDDKCQMWQTLEMDTGQQGPLLEEVTLFGASKHLVQCCGNILQIFLRRCESGIGNIYGPLSTLHT